MSVSVAAALKKVAVYIATNKKARKKVVGIVLGAVFIVLLPVIAVLGIFSGGLNIDTDTLKERIEEQQAVASVAMTEIEDAMREDGYTGEDIDKANVLCMFALYPYAREEGFSERLLGCFAAEQTDGELIDKINATFGTQILLEEFTDVLREYREQKTAAE